MWKKTKAFAQTYLKINKTIFYIKGGIFYIYIGCGYIFTYISILCSVVLSKCDTF